MHNRHNITLFAVYEPVNKHIDYAEKGNKDRCQFKNKKMANVCNSQGGNSQGMKEVNAILWVLIYIGCSELQGKIIGLGTGLAASGLIGIIILIVLVVRYCKKKKKDNYVELPGAGEPAVRGRMN